MASLDTWRGFPRKSDACKSPVGKQPRLCREPPCVMPSKQSILVHKHASPAACGRAQNIRMQGIPAHRNSLSRNTWQRCFDRLIYLWERLAEEPYSVGVQVRDQVTVVAWLNREPVVARGR